MKAPKVPGQKDMFALVLSRVPGQFSHCPCGFGAYDPAYSPDLAPSDYFLFCNLKSHLRGVCYPDNEALKEAVKEWLEEQTKDFYFSRINSLPVKYRKCIELSGDYIEE